MGIVGLETAAGAASVARARSALARFAAAPDADGDGLLPAALLALPVSPEPIARRLVERYRRQVPGYGRDNVRRYRWSLGFHAEVGHLEYAEPPGRQTWWRPKEAGLLAEHPGRYARRILVPAALATQLEYWIGLAEGANAALASAARDLLDEAQPIADSDVARWIAADDPWADTFALWVITSHPGAHARLRDLTFALAVRYAQIAVPHGVVPGIKYPFFGEPLVSATAHLATSLWRLGIYPSRLPEFVSFVAEQSKPDGGWADPDQPSDVLTTLAAAELLTALDPSFDPVATIGFFERHQEPAGWWRALNPEVPWLTGAIARWIERAVLPFADRFAWPDLPVWSRDRLTGLPTLAVFDELCVALAGLPGLRETSLEVAFIDLAGFGDFNTARGQDAGDAALAAYGRALARVPHSLAIRQGGDELLVIGTPGTAGELEPALRQFMTDWLDLGTEAGIRPGEVVPRIVVVDGAASRLREMRGLLGQAIGPVKRAFNQPDPPGVLQRL